MSRPLRIVYPYAWYHVMNRGAGRRKIFKSHLHKKMFLDLLEESHNMFNVIICAYCLMDNHYHLLLCTPEANLPRVMRHINGVYTQKYNRSSKTDGSLFRGRYQSKLIDEDCYQLIVSRYIHLNPVEAGFVKNPADYEWSSYRAYLGLVKSPVWLSKDMMIKNLLETQSLLHMKDYKNYVETQDIGAITVYASTKNTSPIIGSEKFRQKIISQIEQVVPDACSPELNRTKVVPDIALIIKHVCDFFKIKNDLLVNCKSATLNWPHLVCMYICRKRYGHALRDIASCFGFKRQETISSKVRKCCMHLSNNPKLFNEIEMICNLIKASLEKAPH